MNHAQEDKKLRFKQRTLFSKLGKLISLADWFTFPSSVPSDNKSVY